MAAVENKAHDPLQIVPRERFAAGEPHLPNAAGGGEKLFKVFEELLGGRLGQRGALGAELFAVRAAARAACGDGHAHAAQVAPQAGHVGSGEAVTHLAGAPCQRAQPGRTQTGKVPPRPEAARAEGQGYGGWRQYARAGGRFIIKSVVRIARGVPRLAHREHVHDASPQHAQPVRGAGHAVPDGIERHRARAADDSQRVLILIAQPALKVLQRLHAAAVDVELAPFGQVAQQHAGVERRRHGHAEGGAHPPGRLRRVQHGGQQRVSHVHGIESRHILQHDDVAIQIEQLVLLREDIRGHEAVVGLLRVPLHLAHGAVQVVSDLAQLDAHVFARKGGQRLRRILRKPLVEDVDDILVLRGGVFQHGGDGDAAVGNVLVVGGEEDGNAHAIHPFVKRVLREGESVR